MKNGVETTLICDNMAAWVMSKGMVDCVIVGSDRIASNGDVANKIGTYGVAISAKAHGIPFYVVAPFSTIDMKLASGEEIPIEERKPGGDHFAGRVTGSHRNRSASTTRPSMSRPTAM